MNKPSAGAFFGKAVADLKNLTQLHAEDVDPIAALPFPLHVDPCIVAFGGDFGGSKRARGFDELLHLEAIVMVVKGQAATTKGE